MTYRGTCAGKCSRDGCPGRAPSLGGRRTGMHDIDRTQLEAAQGFGFESAGPGEFGPGGGGEIGEFGEAGEVGEFGEAGKFGGYAGPGPGHETPLSEPREMELASELVEVSS